MQKTFRQNGKNALLKPNRDLSQEAAENSVITLKLDIRTFLNITRRFFGSVRLKFMNGGYFGSPQIGKKKN